MLGPDRQHCRIKINLLSSILSSFTAQKAHVQTNPQSLVFLSQDTVSQRSVQIVSSSFEEFHLTVNETFQVDVKNLKECLALFGKPQTIGPMDQFVRPSPTCDLLFDSNEMSLGLR
jgi:hypothetical protein